MIDLITQHISSVEKLAVIASACTIPSSKMEIAPLSKFEEWIAIA